MSELRGDVAHLEEVPAPVSELQPSLSLLGAYPHRPAMPRGDCLWSWRTDCPQPASGFTSGSILPQMWTGGCFFLFGLTAFCTLCPSHQGAVASSSYNPITVWTNPDLALNIYNFPHQEPQQLWNQASKCLIGHEGAGLDLNAFALFVLLRGHY